MPEGDGSERPVLGLKKQPQPAPDAMADSAPAGPAPFTWTPGPKLGPRLLAYAGRIGRGPGKVVSECVRARLTNASRGGLKSKLVLAGVPAGLGDRIGEAARRDGAGSVSEWAVTALEAALAARETEGEEPAAADAESL